MQMFTVREYDHYHLMVLHGLDTDDIEGCEFSKKFRVQTRGDTEEDGTIREETIPIRPDTLPYPAGQAYAMDRNPLYATYVD